MLSKTFVRPSTRSTDASRMAKNALAVAAAVVGVPAVLAGGWFGYWALAKANTAQRYEVNTGTQQYQAGLIDRARNLSSDYYHSNNPGQRAAIAEQFCTTYPNIVPPPADLQSAASTMCVGVNR